MRSADDDGASGDVYGMTEQIELGIVKVTESRQLRGLRPRLRSRASPLCAESEAPSSPCSFARSPTLRSLASAGLF
eukprot:CAMPEP_0198653424 /NCGR_PEP_ID=MMETSP1467-20131203/7041_1 /TAXON_ID=1462469 /ORGANISM="unid. sp., Strain CCMP2135" /LENGTH=75 /DNA_ID=CAMNT_0044389385 /DNA_START=314 /DNA_END=541 /DNA_ORIENTATION=-